MKINIVVPMIYKVGGIKTVCEYANSFSHNGNEVTLYAPIIPYNMETGKNNFLHILKNLHRCFIRILSLGKNLKKFGRIDFKVKQVPVINDFFLADADVTIATSWPTAYSVHNMKFKAGKKVYFVQGYEDWNSNSGLVDESYKLGLEIITTSNYLSKFLKDKFNLESKIVFNSVNTLIFSNPNVRSGSAKSLLFIDHEMQLKNTKLAIEVVCEIKEKYPHFIVQAFGHKRKHHLPDFVSFHENPSEKEIVKLYCDSDIFLYTSNYEGFALPPAEAMACASAVVTTKVGAVPEYSTNLYSSIHVEPGDKKGLLEGIISLIENEKLFEYISANAVSDANKYLDCFEKSSSDFEKIIIENVNLEQKSI
jgi:glycosyltransferase involved in cell wall biosynthesis